MTNATLAPARSAGINYTRIPTLDGWRAVAIIAVLCAHTRWPIPIISRISAYGGWGVELFFALSGFLITSRLLEEYDQSGRISWRNFYLRRAFRILPPAFAVLAFLAILGLGLHLIPINVKQLVASALFYRNYLGPGWYTGHFWSLAVEEQFYLFWPAVLATVGVARGARAALTLACVAVVWRLADQHFDWLGRLQPFLHGMDHRTDYRIGELFWGCVLAFLWRAEAARRALRKYVRSYWVMGAIALQILLLLAKSSWSETGIEMLMALLPLITIADPQGWVSRLLETRPLPWIGHLSYSLYLWQQFFLTMRVTRHLFGPSVGLILNILFTFVAASLSYYFIERPSIALGKRLQRAPLKVAGSHTG